MPRRTSVLTSTSSTPAPLPPRPLPTSLTLLRQQWKWAAFCQFFFTFSPLFAMDDISITDVEEDLTYSTNFVLPRVMQRLLFTLTQDRKITLDNWQTSLRKQYLRRDPQANPIGLDSSFISRDVSISQEHTLSLELKLDESASVAFDDVVSSVRQTPDFVIGEDVSCKDGIVEGGESLGVDDSSHSFTEQDPPLEWRDLSMLVKLDSMHDVVEWHFHNPMRLRHIMKDDDENAQWRTEPIGYDSKANAYWLIGPDRLWVQRIPPKSKTLKRKRTTTTVSVGRNRPSSISSKDRDSSLLIISRKRQRMLPEEDQESVPPRPRTIKRAHPLDSEGTSMRDVRAAKLKANKRLDAQAKELAEIHRQLSKSKASTLTKPTTSSPKPIGTRLSARLRGTLADDEWQAVPEEWLTASTSATSSSAKNEVDRNPGHLRASPSNRLKTGLETDVESISDLTELSDNSSDEKSSRSAVCDHSDIKLRDPNTQQRIHPDSDNDERNLLPDDFVEWETLCVTLHDWSNIAQKFSHSSHYAEKALYKVLVNDLVPVMSEMLRETERKQRLEEAIVHRKRSSRIAIKESEREEARLIAKRKAEEEEKFSRSRRLEARLRKEEAERERREYSREQRRKEREEKERRQAIQILDTPVNVSDSKPSNVHITGAAAPNVELAKILNGPSSGSRTPVGDDWELACEVCLRHGINQDDGTPMMCCGSCGKWQHIVCHDRADALAGRAKRNWDAEEFVCQQCLPRTSNNPLPLERHQTWPSPGRIYPLDNTQPPPQNYVQAAPHATIAFSHYQPEQHGFSSRSVALNTWHDQRLLPPPSHNPLRYIDSVAESRLTPQSSTQLQHNQQYLQPHWNSAPFPQEHASFIGIISHGQTHAAPVQNPRVMSHSTSAAVTHHQPPQLHYRSTMGSSSYHPSS